MKETYRGPSKTTRRLKEYKRQAKHLRKIEEKRLKRHKDYQEENFIKKAK